jgi:hypothetical protein
MECAGDGCHRFDSPNLGVTVAYPKAFIERRNEKVAPPAPPPPPLLFPPVTTAVVVVLVVALAVRHVFVSIVCFPQDSLR